MNLLLCTADSNVKAIFATLLVEPTKVVNEAAACVLGISDREHNHVTLVTLNAFNVLNKEAGVLTVILARHFSANGRAEFGIFNRFFIDYVINHIALRYVKGDNANGLVVLSGCKELFNQLNNAFCLFAVGTALPYGILHLVNLNRRLFGLVGVGSNKQSSFIESIVREVDELLILRTVVRVQEHVGVAETSKVQKTFFFKSCCNLCILIQHIFQVEATVAKAGGTELLVVTRNNNLLCTRNRGNTLFNVELRCLVKDNEIEQIVLLGQNLRYCIGCHQPNLESLKDFKVELLNKLAYAAASAALNSAADFALALGGGDILDIISQQLCDALTGELLLDFDVVLHRGDDLFKGVNLGDERAVFAFKLLNVLKQNGVVEFIIPFGYGAAANLVDFAKCRKIQVFVCGQAHNHGLEVCITCCEFLQALLYCLGLFHHQTNGIRAARLLEVCLGQVLNFLCQASLRGLTLHKGLVAPLVNLENHFVNGIGEENEIVVGKIVLHLQEPRVTLNGELIVVKAVGELSVGELFVNCRNLVIVEVEQFIGNHCANGLVGFNLLVILQIDAAILHVKLVGSHTEFTGREKLVSNDFKRCNVGVDLSRNGGEIGCFNGSVCIGAEQEALELTVEQIFIVCVVHHNRIAGEGAQTRVNNVKRGFLFRNHQNVFALIYKLGNQAGNGLGFTRAGRALNNQLIGGVERVEDGFLCRVERIDVNQRVFIDACLLQLGIACVVVGVKVGRAVIRNKVSNQVVDQTLVQHFLKVALNCIGICRELAHNNVVHQFEGAARVVREGFTGIFGKLFQLVAVILNANVIGSIEIEQGLQERIGIDLLGHAIGHRRGNAVEFIMCQHQRVVVNNVTCGVKGNRNRGCASVENNGEEAQGRTNAKLTVGKASLHKGITDVKIVLTLITHFTGALTNEVDKILIPVTCGVGARQILIGCLGNHHCVPLTKKNLERIVATVCIKEVNGILCRQFGQKEHAVGLVDVDQLFGKLAQGFLNVIRNIGRASGIAALQNGKKFVGKIFYKSGANTANAIKVRGLLRHQTNHFTQSVIGANGRCSTGLCFFTFSDLLAQKVERIKEFRITFHTNNPSFIKSINSQKYI